MIFNKLQSKKFIMQRFGFAKLADNYETKIETLPKNQKDVAFIEIVNIPPIKPTQMKYRIVNKFVI